MSTAVVAEAPRKLDVGRVATETFALLKRRWLLLVALNLGLLVPALFLLAIGMSLTNQLVTSTPILALPGVILSLASIVLMLLIPVAQTAVAIADLEGEKPRFGAAVTLGLSKLAPVIGASILMALGLGLGFLLLVIPGLILGVAWSLAMPIIVAESANIPRALGRSRILTRGNRWRIFLLLAATVVASALVSLAAGALGARNAAGSAVSLVVLLLNLVYSLVMSVGAAVLYTQLRDLKGGGGERLAQAFA